MRLRNKLGIPLSNGCGGQGRQRLRDSTSNYMLTSSKVLDLGRNSSNFSMAFWLYPEPATRRTTTTMTNWTR